MRSISEINDAIDRLVKYYTGDDFFGVLYCERGYHLVRALDEMVYDQWFMPYKPVINFYSKGPNECLIEIKEVPGFNYSITIKASEGTDAQVVADLHHTPI